MCMPSPKTPQTPPPAPPPPPPAPITTLQAAAASGEGSTGSNRQAVTKGRKSLRIDLASSNPTGSTGLNLPVG